MTTKIELLPLPEGEASSFGDYQVHDNEAMIEYARSNVALNTALLRAEIKALRAEVHALREALTAMVSWFPSADTYLRLGFDPSAPMEALKEAKAVLFKENGNETRNLR